MNERLAELDNFYFEQILHVFRRLSLILPVIVVGLGLLVRQGWFDNRFYANDILFGMIALLFLISSFLQWTNQNNRMKVQALITTLFHIAGILYLVYVSGVFSPFLICWIVLYVATDTYFGTKAALLSLSGLFVAFLLEMLLHPGLAPNDLVTTLTALLFVLVICWLISKLRKLNEAERVAYNKSRRIETLQRERLTTLVNAMGDAVISTDDRGIIRVYNAATLNLLDTNATLSGQKLSKVLHLVDDQGKKVDLLAYIHANDHVFTRRDLSHVYADGEKVDLSVNVSPLRPGYRQRGVQNGYIFLIRDITKEKSLEEERDEFISVVSHELRTPIAIMEGNLSNVQFILDQAPAGSHPPNVSRALSDAHEQVIYLAKLINDLSTLSRAERGVADTPENIDVTELMHNMFNEYQPQATAKKLKMDLDLSTSLASVNVSRLYLEEILQNLITNAIKYTQTGTVTLSAHRDGNEIEFAVRDTGIGISKSDQKRIFEKFYRSEDYRTRETTGTGLGLYVVRKLSHKLGTTIELKSRLNHGSTFSFRLAV